MYIIKAIVSESRDIVMLVPRKRLAIQYPGEMTVRGIDIPYATKDNIGQIKKAACDALGVGPNEVRVGDKLKNTLKGIT